MGIKSIIIFTLVSLSAVSCVNSQNCVDGINKLPMFGHVKKCDDQIKADKLFLANYDSPKSRKEATAHIIMRGWQYFHSRNLDTSMMRFNQAWLLDSLNADVYWGFANILGVQRKFKESLSFFERSTKLNPNNANVWNDMSMSYGNLFFETKDQKYLDASISALKKAVHLDSRNPQFYAQLTTAYCYYMQKDSARRYFKITEQLDPKAINPEVRKLLADK